MTAFALVQQAAPTSTGTQDYTSSGFGTPDAVLFWWTPATANDTPVAHAIFGIGAADGTNQWALTTRAEDAQGTTDTDRRGMTDECICLLATDTSIDGEANWTAWITDGVRITWGNAPAGAYLVNCLLIQADNAQVGTFTAAGPNGTQTTVTTGFEPDLVWFFGHGTSFGDSTSATNPLNFGIADNQATIVNRAKTFACVNGYDTTQSCGGIWNDRCACNLDPASEQISRSFKVVEFTATSFKVEHIAGAHSSDLVSAYVALDLGSLQHWVDFIAITTGTGSKAFTAPGFKPQLLGLMPSWSESADINVLKTDGKAGVHGLGFATGASEEYSCSVADEDAQATSDTESRTDSKIVNFPEHDGTDGYEADLTSFDASGFTLNATVNAAGATTYWPAFAIEEEAAGGTILPMMIHHHGG